MKTGLFRTGVWLVSSIYGGYGLHQTPHFLPTPQLRTPAVGGDAHAGYPQHFTTHLRYDHAYLPASDGRVCGHCLTDMSRAGRGRGRSWASRWPARGSWSGQGRCSRTQVALCYVFDSPVYVHGVFVVACVCIAPSEA